MREVITIMDNKGFSNSEIIEFILVNNKTKVYFKGLYKSQSTSIINKILNSLGQNYSYSNRDSCIRLLGHLCFEENEIDN